MTFKFPFTVFITIAIALVLAPASAAAQGQAIDGIIEGIVRAQSGDAPVPGANVRAFNTGTAYERAVTSDEAGRYSIPLLPPGEYVVFVEAPTFATMSQNGVQLRAGQVMTVEFKLPGAVKKTAKSAPAPAAEVTPAPVEAQPVTHGRRTTDRLLDTC